MTDLKERNIAGIFFLAQEFKFVWLGVRFAILDWTAADYQLFLCFIIIIGEISDLFKLINFFLFIEFSEIFIYLE